ncbi:hypothetical protein [Acaryochloris thomasi]|uniref:hypothetical protein n=1 Tax=Acaryochloris thomasi TaxID=2929456 RepID=UPI001314E0F6|nr:hypothetical protein [Acaryochloris thomasi]
MTFLLQNTDCYVINAPSLYSQRGRRQQIPMPLKRLYLKATIGKALRDLTLRLYAKCLV